MDYPPAHDQGKAPHRPDEAGAPVQADGRTGGTGANGGGTGANGGGTGGTGANGGTAGHPATAGAASAAGREPAGGEAAGGAVTVVPGIARYHKPDCILIRFLGAEDLQTMSLGQAEQTGCVPCRACRPEKEPATA